MTTPHDPLLYDWKVPFIDRIRGRLFGQEYWYPTMYCYNCGYGVRDHVTSCATHLCPNCKESYHWINAEGKIAMVLR